MYIHTRVRARTHTHTQGTFNMPGLISSTWLQSSVGNGWVWVVAGWVCACAQVDIKIVLTHRGERPQQLTYAILESVLCVVHESSVVQSFYLLRLVSFAVVAGVCVRTFARVCVGVLLHKGEWAYVGVCAHVKRACVCLCCPVFTLA